MAKLPVKRDELLSPSADLKVLEDEARLYREIAVKAVASFDKFLTFIREHERLKEQLESAKRVRGWRDVLDRIRDDDPNLAALLERASLRSYSPDEILLEAEPEDQALIKIHARRISSFCAQVLGVRSKIQAVRAK